ncbi:ABA4-like family protein [Aurantiacibacter sp. MUD61]|uniref:ABA4-like family protein n=1 Tax=Aurantiacibacter sp. MUD61 TaxID=3009083 RepID=UPI0022F13177|nr:ABA4-like family protein [Aurantiacibacter sp. MUD61]
MSWDTIFQLANGWALLMWLVLILLPRKPFPLAFVFYAGVGLLCLAYASIMALVVSGSVDPVPVTESDVSGSFTSIAGVRALFTSDGGIVIGWIHYLALDLFAGLWIAKDADAKGFSRILQAPVLALTFMAGPAGLLLWFIIRERRARAAAGLRKVN